MTSFKVHEGFKRLFLKGKNKMFKKGGNFKNNKATAAAVISRLRISKNGERKEI